MSERDITVRVLTSLSDIDAAIWDACAVPDRVANAGAAAPESKSQAP